MSEKNVQTIPVGSLGIIAMENIRPLSEKVDAYLASWRNEREKTSDENALHFKGYQRDSFIVEAKTPRFGSGEGKGVILESVRGMDLYILVDVLNYSLREICSSVKHAENNSVYIQIRVHSLLDHLNSADELAYSFECVELALDRNKYAVDSCK